MDVAKICKKNKKRWSGPEGAKRELRSGRFCPYFRRLFGKSGHSLSVFSVP